LSHSQRRRGFSLVEVIISIALLSIIMALVLPPFTNYRTQQFAGQAAEELAADCRRMSAEALRREGYFYVKIVNSTNYELWDGTETTRTGAVVLRYKARQTMADYGAVTITPVGGSVTDAKLVFGEKGWVRDSTASAEPRTNIQKQTETVTSSGGNFTASYWGFTVTSAPGVAKYTYEVRVYENGRVKVVH